MNATELNDTDPECAPLIPSCLGSVEVVPQEDWIVEAISQTGEPMCFIRLTMTGLLPRRIGPFGNRETALRCLDNLLEDLLRRLETEGAEIIDGDLFLRAQQNRPPILVEDELAQAYLAQTITTQPKTPVLHKKPSKRKAV